jgi:hypothetical protein
MLSEKQELNAWEENTLTQQELEVLKDGVEASWTRPGGKKNT